MSEDGELRRSKTLLEHLRKGLRDAHARRPVSFYLLLSIPLVLILGAHMVEFRGNPVRFLLVLSMLFLFFGIVLLRAVMELFEMARKHALEHKKAFRETLGDSDFISELGDRVRRGRDRHD